MFAVVSQFSISFIRLDLGKGVRMSYYMFTTESSTGVTFFTQIKYSAAACGHAGAWEHAAHAGGTVYHCAFASALFAQSVT